MIPVDVHDKSTCMVNVEPDVAERLRRQSLIAYDEVACRAEGREPPTVRIARFTTASVRCAQDQTTHRPGAVAQCVKCMQPAMMNHVGIGGSGAGDDVRDDHVHTLETLGDGAGSVRSRSWERREYWPSSGRVATLSPVPLGQLLEQRTISQTYVRLQLSR